MSDNVILPPGADLTAEFGWFREDIASLTRELHSALDATGDLVYCAWGVEAEFKETQTVPKELRYLMAASLLHLFESLHTAAWPRVGPVYALSMGTDEPAFSRSGWGYVFRPFAEGIIRTGGFVTSSAHDMAARICGAAEFIFLDATEDPASRSVEAIRARMRKAEARAEAGKPRTTKDTDSRTVAQVSARLEAVGAAFRGWMERFDIQEIMARMQRESALAQHRARPNKPVGLPAMLPGRPGPKANPQKANMVARVLALQSAGSRWPAIYDTINEEFGTSYEYSENGTLHKAVRKHRRRPVR